MTRDRCDALWRAVILARSGGVCARCHRSQSRLECAHIIRRGFSRTRCDPTNGRALCPPCHLTQTLNDWTWPELIGQAEYDRLRTLAHNPAWKRPPDWWDQQAQLLREAA